MAATENKSHQNNTNHKFRHDNLHDAIKHADVKELQRLIQEGASINGIDPKFKFTPIHWAIHYGSIECLHWLLWHGADFHIQSTEGWTPAHIAAIRGRDLCLQSLAANGVDTTILDSRGKTPAHLACSHGNTKSLQEILRKGVDEDIRDSMGWTLTHTAAFHGRLGCLQILKKWGFNMKSLDNSGNSLAHFAAGEGHLLCLKFLVSIASKGDSIVKARNDQGDTPKDTAIQFFKKKCVDYLNGIEYDVEHPESSENLAYPAHNSAYNGDLEFLQMAIETGVASINDRDERGSTPAHKAAGNGQLDILKWLMERGANMSILNTAGETPRDIALRFGKLDCAKLISGETDFENNDDEGTEVSPDGIQSKDEAKVRAHRKLNEMKDQLEIAKLNFQHLGGVLPGDSQKLKEQLENARVTRELEEQLEYERIKREKLESQLDTMRLEVQNLNRELDDARRLVVPKPPSAEKSKITPEAIVKGSPVIPKTKKKKRRTRPKSGVFLVQRTPGVYEPLSLSSGGMMSNNRPFNSASVFSTKADGEKRKSSSSTRPKTALASYKSPFDSKDVSSRSHGRKSIESNGDSHVFLDRQMSPRNGNDNSSFIGSPREDSLKSQSNASRPSHCHSDASDTSRRDSNTTLDSRRGSNENDGSPLRTDGSDVEEKSLNLSVSSRSSKQSNSR